MIDFNEMQRSMPNHIQYMKSTVCPLPFSSLVFTVVRDHGARTGMMIIILTNDS